MRRRIRPHFQDVAFHARFALCLAVYELSRLLNTGLDRDTLAILMALIQKGVNPEALAAVVKDLRKEAAETAQEPRERTFTGGKQPLSAQELQVSQVCGQKPNRTSVPLKSTHDALCCTAVLEKAPFRLLIDSISTLSIK